MFAVLSHTLSRSIYRKLCVYAQKRVVYSVGFVFICQFRLLQFGFMLGVVFRMCVGVCMCLLCKCVCVCVCVYIEKYIYLCVYIEILYL